MTTDTSNDYLFDSFGRYRPERFTPANHNKGDAMTTATAATAEQLASAVYDALTETPLAYDETPDGFERIILRNGWALRINDDGDERSPHGISWWMDSPEERLVESDGWEILPEDQLADAATKLAAYFERAAQ